MTDSAAASPMTQPAYRCALLVSGGAGVVELVRVLGDAGWRVEERHDPPAALEALESAGGGLPDVVAVDVRMPGAVVLLQQLAHRRPDLPVVALSDDAGQDGDALRHAGLDPAVGGTLDMDALAAAMARLASPGDDAPPPTTLVQAAAQLFPAQPGASERRRERRFELRRPRGARLAAPGSESARSAVVADVASRGLGLGLVAQGGEVEVGGPVLLDVDTAGGRASVMVRGTVRWARHEGESLLAGVELDRPDSTEARRLVYDLLVND